jgi:hypothetical protein
MGKIREIRNEVKKGFTFISCHTPELPRAVIVSMYREENTWFEDFEG